MSKALILAAIALTPFSDFPLQETALGFLGASPSFIPLGLLLSGMLVGAIFKTIRLTVVIAILWVALVSIYGLLYFGFQYGNENLLDKGVRLIVLLALFLSPFALNLDKKVVQMGSTMALMALFIGLFWVDVLGNSMFLHSTPNENMRPRSFTLESSHFAMTLIALLTLSLSTLDNRYLKLLLSMLGLGALLYSGSKGGVAILVVSLAILIGFHVFRLVSVNAKFKIKRIPAALIGIAAISIGLMFLFGRVVDGLLLDMDYYTSTATRVTLVLSSLYVFYQHPLGVGTTGYLPALIHGISSSIETLSTQFATSLNFSEVEGYVGAESDKYISTKVFFFDGLIWFGLPFVLLYLLFSFWLLVGLFKKGDAVLFIGTSALLIGLATFSGGLGLYAVTFALSWARTQVCGLKTTPFAVHERRMAG
jgi:hypothetical protein